MTKIQTKKESMQSIAGNARLTREVTKIASESMAVSRLPLGEIGTLGLGQIAGYIYEQAKSELRHPQSLRTYKNMRLDPVISAANNVLDVMIGKVDWKFEAPRGAPQEAIDAAEFLTYCMNNLYRQSWADFINDVGSYRIYGFHIAEKVFTSVTTGKWKGRYKWKKLAGRSQHSITKWNFDESTRELLSVEQNTAMVNSGRGMPVTIPRNKFLHFRYDPKRDNPEGNSPLLGAYFPWKYKQVFEELEACGIAKDMNGIMHMQVDVAYLQKATLNPEGPEARVLNEMRLNAANFQKSEQAYILSPISYNDTGKELFKVGVIGVEGAGKKDSIDVAIKRKQTEILMAYLADVLQLGNTTHGSFSLADAKTNLLGHAVEYHLKIIADVINNDLVPQTLAVNGWLFDEEWMPKAIFGDIEKQSLEEFSTMIQRISSTNNLPRTPEMVNEILEQTGFTYRIDKDISDDAFEKLFPNNESRAADGMKTGMGNGTSKKPSTRDNTSANQSI